MTLFFKNHQITILRAHNIGGIKYAFSATFTAFSGDIQPQSAERASLTGGRVGKSYTAFIDATMEVKEGDKIRTEDGKQYAVRSVSTWEGAGLLDHKELTVEAED